MNSYAEEIPNVEGSKIMISEEQIVFILHSNSLIERHDGKWACVNQNTQLPSDYTLASYPVKYGNYIYFLLTDNIMYRFYLLNKTIERVKQFQIA